MMKRLAMICLFGMVGILIGCSTNGTDAITPAGPDSNTIPVVETAGQSTHQLWGFYTIEIDSLNQTVNIIDARDTEFHLNVVGFVEPPGCPNCLRLENFVWSDYHLALDVGFLHPFTGLTEFSGFDVRGVVMFNGSYNFPEMMLRTKGENDGGLSNPDGYTSLYAYGTPEYKPANMSSPVPPNASLNGYIEHHHLEARHMYRPIASIPYREYEIDLPKDGSFLSYFNYAIDASWQFPDTVPATIDDFTINANCWEAYQITTELDGTVAASEGSSAELKIFVYDWQGPESILSVTVESPELFEDTVEATLIDSGLFPDWGGWALYTAVIRNEIAGLDPEEPYRVLIAAVDELDDTVPQDMTAYQIYEGTISPNEPPVAVAEVDNDSPSTGANVNFTGHDSYDPEDTTVSEYHWDLDGDLVYDDSDVADPTWSYADEGTYYVDLKVYDSDGAWDTLDVKIEINVTGGVEVTLQEYYDKTLHDTTDPLDGFRMRLFNSPVSGLQYQWSNGNKLQQAWNFSGYGITDSGYRGYDASPWAAANCSSPWSGNACVETASTLGAGNLLYQGVFILDWVYSANIPGNTLRMVGWDGWDELEDPLHFFADYTWADHVSPTNWNITFPLNVDHTGHIYSGSGGFLRWADYWSPGGCGSANFTSSGFKFDVIGQGTIVTDYYTTATPCILVRHVYNYSLGGTAVVLTKEMVWYEWIVDDGSTAAFMTTFNNAANPYADPPAVNRFNAFSPPYAISGQCVIGQRYN